MEMLRAERAKSSENIIFISSKSIELDSRITQLRSSIREKRTDLNKVKTESLKTGKNILSSYYQTIKASRNVDSLSKMIPVIKPQQLNDIKVYYYTILLIEYIVYVHLHSVLQKVESKWKKVRLFHYNINCS